MISRCPQCHGSLCEVVNRLASVEMTNQMRIKKSPSHLLVTPTHCLCWGGFRASPLNRQAGAGQDWESKQNSIEEAVSDKYK